MRKWEDQEQRLESIRAKEKVREERSRKKRRIEDYAASRSTEDDEEAEWLLDDWDGNQKSGPQDALSGLSKESREVLEKLGLGAPKQQNDENEGLEEGIKVRNFLPRAVWAHHSNMLRRFTTPHARIRNYRSSLLSCEGPTSLHQSRLL